VKQKPGRGLLEFCRDRRADVLRFAADTTIWPANNLSERGVRPLKTQQEISGRLASDEVTQDRLDIRGYIDTARKHGLNALDVLHQLMLGNPLAAPSPANLPVTPPRKRATSNPLAIGVNAQGKSARLGLAGYCRK
jgi:transposase